MVFGIFKKKFRILESSDMWLQKCLKREVCGDLVSQRVSGDKIVLVVDNRIDVYKFKRQNCRIQELSKVEKLYKKVIYY